MSRTRRRAFAIMAALAALACLLATGGHPPLAPRENVYYCWNPAIGFALPCRYVKAERDV